uniref:Uncharacterized protein n=1 Tax=Romanomermis culicivorax TaxID=13658 RepID=A0A915I2Q3_ROMCU
MDTRLIFAVTLYLAFDLIIRGKDSQAHVHNMCYLFVNCPKKACPKVNNKTIVSGGIDDFDNGGNVNSKNCNQTSTIRKSLANEDMHFVPNYVFE